MVIQVLKVTLISLVIMKILVFGFIKIEGYNQEYYICPPYCGVDHDHKKEDDEED